MPVITFRMEYLSRLIGKSFSKKKLESEALALGFETERMDDKEVSIEITPNRPDLFTAIGFVRALKYFEHRKTYLGYTLGESSPSFEIFVEKGVERVRPFISAVVARNLELDEDALADLINFSEKFCELYGRRRRKIAMGMHDLSGCTPPFHYGAYGDEKFTPLNATEEASFSEVLNEHEKGVQYGGILGGNATALYPALKDAKGVMALIPIINSERTKISSKTKDMLIDITGTSEYLVGKTADLLASIFMDLGADIERVSVRYPTKSDIFPKAERRYLEIELSRMEQEIGVAIGSGNMISLANKMGYEAAIVGRNMRFSVPPYRLDIINEQDIIEDIAIAYGYDYIAPITVPSIGSGNLSKSSVLFSRVSELMIGLGFSEMLNSYLTNEKANFSEMRIAEDKDYVKIKNPKAESITMVRTWVLPSILRSIGLSRHDRMPQKVFELDLAVMMKGEKPSEEYHLAAAAAGPKVNFNDAKAIAEALLHSLSPSSNILKYEHPSFIEGRCASIALDGKVIGFFGELHPEVLFNAGIEEPTIGMEMNISALLGE